LFIISTLKMAAIISFETSIITRATWHHITEDGILRVMYIIAILICFFNDVLSNLDTERWD
jgi:hypothetical protein